MNKSIYESNMKALEKKYPAWAEIIKSIKRKKRKFDVIVEESIQGIPILKICQNGKVRYLNGKYEPSAVVNKWIEEQKKIEEFATIVIIGISNGMHIRSILDYIPKTANVLIYEPSLEIFRRALEEVELSFLFQPDIPVGIIVGGLNESEIPLYLRYFITLENMVLMKLYVSGNYMDLFEEQVGSFVQQLQKHINFIQVNWNTVVRYTNVNANNIFHNLPHLFEGTSIRELQGILPQDVPVVIVSAGPSLNKNIMDLKLAQGKACIIATDTAIKPLLNAGIIPHLFVIVDGLKPEKLFQHKDISKIGMVTMTGVSVEPMSLHKGRKFFYYSGSGFENEILQKLSRKEEQNRILPDLPTGGSVATTAYSLGIYMGSRTIILVGQDLAMTGNRTHADGTFQDKMDEINIESGEYFEIESIDGRKVLSRGDFKYYLNWFEDRIKEWKHILTIDATEGGALIHGSKVMTLKKAIQKYCKIDFNVKWHISHTKKLFTKENRIIALEYFYNSEKKLQEVKKKAKTGLRNYEKLEKLATEKVLADEEITKILKKIQKINHYMETDYMAWTVIDSLRGIDSTLRPLIYQVQERRQDEMKDIAEQGKVMLYAITVAAEQISKIAHDTLVLYAEERLQLKKAADKRECDD